MWSLKEHITAVHFCSITIKVYGHIDRGRCERLVCGTETHDDQSGTAWLNLSGRRVWLGESPHPTTPTSNTHPLKMCCMCKSLISSCFRSLWCILLWFQLFPLEASYKRPNFYQTTERHAEKILRLLVSRRSWVRTLGVWLNTHT